jgi:hypothetical protein
MLSARQRVANKTPGMKNTCKSRLAGYLVKRRVTGRERLGRSRETYGGRSQYCKYLHNYCFFILHMF